MSSRDRLEIISDGYFTLADARASWKGRLTHLGKMGRTCEDTEWLLELTRPILCDIDERLKHKARTHPTYRWWKRVKGAGEHLMALILGAIEGFGRYYPRGDPRIPPEVNRAPETLLDGKGKGVEVVWVEGIERLRTPAKLRKFAGIYPGASRKKGERLPYSNELKMLLLGRLATSFLNQRGRFYELYIEAKEYYRNRAEREGKKILPTPLQRECPCCGKVEGKAVRYCPSCGKKLLKKEPPDVIYREHLHRLAVRLMARVFIDLLWIVWRREVGLPVSRHYTVFLGRRIYPEDVQED